MARDEAQAELARIREAAIRAEEATSLRRVQSMSGLPPTNLSREQPSPVLVVGSRRRRREDEGEEEASTQIEKKSDERPLKRPRFTTGKPMIIESSRPSYLSYTTTDPSIALPTEFDMPDRHSHLSLVPKILPNGGVRHVITFTLHPLPAGDDSDASSLRTTRHIPVECGIYYYEIEVLDQGEQGFM
ncbi:hypothetical protein TREMEDRAFT_56196, partial [Tremella mesenterica DSM 1558]